MTQSLDYQVREAVDVAVCRDRFDGHSTIMTSKSFDLLIELEGDRAVRDTHIVVHGKVQRVWRASVARVGGDETVGPLVPELEEGNGHR